MTLFDGVVLGIVAVSCLLGGWRGFVNELLSLAAWIVAFIATKMFGPALVPMMPATLVDPLLRTLAAYLGLFVAILVVVTLVRWLLREMLRAAGLGVIDRVLGAAFGVARGVAIVLVGVGLAGMTKLPKETWWTEATLSAPLATAVVALEPWMPQDVAKRIRFK